MKFKFEHSDLEYTLEDLCNKFGCNIIPVDADNLEADSLIYCDINEEGKITRSEENNGGKTSYYDLPLPNRYKLWDILSDANVPGPGITYILDSIYSRLPSTLNDLIEYKDMYPFQHEIFKACYALQERADKDIKGGGILRELNKMKYYIERGIDLAKAGKI